MKISAAAMKTLFVPLIGAKQIPDAAIESLGGIAYFTSGTGDLRLDVTT